MEKYIKILEQELSELNCKATIYEHKKTGARICTFKTDDINKVFTIAFKTPAKDSTGVTHIIEHSVLCGSKKYPLKDPFVELLKGSLNTFLNAFTFPDKTMYPCASTNDKDFKNLMDIYLDAVFFPKMYTCKNVFLQEGWHYEIFNKDDDIKYNGVVYNEMKGAFSNKDEVLQESILNNLFPNSTYKFISGGDPKYIVDLTYEDFINFHKKYYSPSNSYIFLYGNMDFEERLDYLDREYLSKFEKIDVNPIIEDGFDDAKHVEKTIYYPISKDQTKENEANFAYSLVLKSALDLKEDMAFDILSKILIDSPSAILKENLLKAGIGNDIVGGNEGGIKNNYFLVVSKNAKIEQKEEFIKVCNDTFKYLANGGLDHESIKAYLNNIEFKIRENTFSRFPLGLLIIMKSMDTWLYDDSKPFLKLDLLKYVTELREVVDEGYFEDLIKKYLLTNDHTLLITQLPSKTLEGEEEKALNEKLAKFKKSLTDEEIDELIKMNESLREYQSTPDSSEVIKSLPHLKLEDLNQKVENYKCDLIKGDYDFYYSNYFTNNIVYGEFLFDATNVSYKKVKELRLLVECLSKLPTSKHTNKEIDKIIGNSLGEFNATIDLYPSRKDLSYKLLVGFDFSCLLEKLTCAKDLAIEFIYDLVFDEKKILEVIGSEKSRLDGAIDYGSVLALYRARRNFSKRDFVNDEISGVGYIKFINDLLNNFETKKEQLIKDLKTLFKEIFVKEKFLSFGTLESKNNEEFKKVCDIFFQKLPKETPSFFKNEDFVASKNIKEGLMCQASVNFVARAALLDINDFKFSGKMDVLSNALGIDYMWQNIRVKGGAYGASFSLNSFNGLSISSYRDPNILKTDEAYKSIPEFIRNMNYSDDEMLKLKIGALSNMIFVLHSKKKGRLAFGRVMGKLTYDDVLKIENELLSTSNSDLVSYAPLVEELINKSNLCVIGNEKQIEKNKSLFDITEKLS